MKEFKTVEEMRNDEELQSMGRYQWQKVKVDEKELYLSCLWREDGFSC